jgi:hypothetical protein
LPVLIGIAGLIASPAEANPLRDCFERVAVAARRVIHHHNAAPRQIVHRVHPRRRRHASPTAAYSYRMRYVLRPRACAQHPDIAISFAPGAEPPQTTQDLLDELAGLAEAQPDDVTLPAAPPEDGDDPLTPGVPPGPDNPPPLMPPVSMPPWTVLVPPTPPIDAGPPTAPALIPEPATWELLVLGFLGLGVALRRHRRRRQTAMQASPAEARCWPPWTARA